MKRYELAMNKRISTVADLKAFSREVLLEDGVDIDIVNIKTEGVSIESFKKLVVAIYNLGFKEGQEEFASIRGKRKQLEREGKILTKHQRTAKFFTEKNEINK